MASVRELTLKLNADTQGMQSEMKSAGGKTNAILSGVFGGIAAMGTQAFAQAGQAAFQFGKDAIEEASNISESISKIGQVFGKSAKEATAFAKNANKSMGLADEEATNYMGTLGAMYTGLGNTQEQSLKMSKSTMQLAADLGSFNNVSTPETLDMMSSAFRGEYDSIQRMLPGLNAAAVEQEAMAETGKANAKELTAQEKAAATLNLMYKQAGPAVGDFARTSDGAANKQKILAAQMEDTKAAIGAKLLPAWNAVLDFILNKLFPGIEWFINWIQDKMIPWIKEAWDAIWVYLGPVVENVKGMIEGIWRVLSNLIGLVVNVFQGDWKDAWNNILNIFKGIWQYISNLLSMYWKYIQAIWDGILITLRTVGGWIWDAITFPYRKAWEFLQWIFAVITGGIHSAWDGMYNALGSTGRRIMDIIKWPFETAWNFIKGFWNRTFGSIKIKIPDIPGFPGRGTEIGFPQLAKGGIVRRPTLAMIGEAGPEAVVPLSKMGEGGRVININVHAGVGDPVEIGRKISQYLGAFEVVNGPRRTKLA